MMSVGSAVDALISGKKVGGFRLYFDYCAGGETNPLKMD